MSLKLKDKFSVTFTCRECGEVGCNQKVDSEIVEKYKEGENDVYECTSSISCPGYDKAVDFSFRVIIDSDDKIIIDEADGIDEDDIRNAFEYIEDEE